MEDEGRLTCVHEARIMKEHDEFERKRSDFRLWIAGLGVQELNQIAKDCELMLDHKAKHLEIEQLNKLWFDGGTAA